MTDLRVWRLRFDKGVDQDVHKYWTQKNGTPGEFDGEWHGHATRFSVFTTAKAKSCPWITNRSKGQIGGGNNWHFELVGRLIPLYDVIGKRKRRSKYVPRGNKLLTVDGKTQEKNDGYEN